MPCSNKKAVANNCVKPKPNTSFVSQMVFSYFMHFTVPMAWLEMHRRELKMNIEQLRSIRNKNVQQQNELMYLEIKEVAESFRNHPESYPWLLTLLSKYALLPTGGFLVSCSSVPEQGGNQWMGSWLTNDQRFIDFDVMADYKTGVLLEVDRWDEISPIISKHCKGTGKSFAYLALQLLAEYGKS